MPVVPLQSHSIARATKDVLLKLSTLTEEAQSHTEGDALNNAARRYTDEIERLQIWAYEHDVESGTLDHRLRDASALRKRVLSLLAQLSGTTETQSRSDSDGEEETSKDAGLETLVAGTAVHLLGGEDDDAASLSLNTEFTLPESLSDSPLTHIHDVVDLLFGLGPTLLDPAPRDRVELAAHKDAAHYDIDHVQARFPRANKSLIERFGRANWERRQHLIKLRSKLDKSDHETPKLHDIGPVHSDLEDLTIESSASDSGLDSSDDNVSEVGEASMALSQSFVGLEEGLPERGPSTMTTSNTHSKFQFSTNDAESTALTEPSQGIPQVEPDVVRYAVPLPPHPNKQLAGEEFICPFCAHKASDISSPADWK